MASSRIQIGHYVLGETLGTGSFGKVKLATHALTGYKVALKIINRKKLSTPEMVERVRREINYLSLLRHPHIIKLYEVITTPADIIMVIEYAGGELFEYIVSHGKLSEEEAGKFFRQIISAIEYCHRKKVVHRDLKPENLLLDPFSNVKLADFGLSNLMADGNFLKTSCGSPNYAAPEVISGKLYAGPEVDVWSCGVILYVMLCGRLPFDDEQIPNLFKKITEGIYTLPSFLSDGVKILLQGMLAVDPLKRITIPEIKETEFFKRNLPDYLRDCDEHTFQNVFNKLDETVVQELERKMRLPNHVVVEQLKASQNNYVKVAYQLAFDYKQTIEFGNFTEKQKRELSTIATPEWTSSQSGSTKVEGSPDSYQDEEVYSSSYITKLPPPMYSTSGDSGPRSGALNPGDLSHPMNIDHVLHSTNSPSLSNSQINHQDQQANASTSSSAAVVQVQTKAKKHKKRSKWHFGIRSRGSPKKIMMELYKAMRNIDLEWKPINTFQVRCRYTENGNLLAKFEIQLYRADTNNYVVDFRNVMEGSNDLITFTFFDTCCRLMFELSISD